MNPPAIQETWVWSLGWEDPLEKGTALPTPVFWPGEFHGLYSPWGCKVSDMPEWLSLHLAAKKSLGSRIWEGLHWTVQVWDVPCCCSQMLDGALFISSRLDVQDESFTWLAVDIGRHLLHTASLAEESRVVRLFTRHLASVQDNQAEAAWPFLTSRTSTLWIKASTSLLRFKDKGIRLYFSMGPVARSQSRTACAMGDTALTSLKDIDLYSSQIKISNPDLLFTLLF